MFTELLPFLSFPLVLSFHLMLQGHYDDSNGKACLCLSPTLSFHSASSLYLDSGFLSWQRPSTSCVSELSSKAHLSLQNASGDSQQSPDQMWRDSLTEHKTELWLTCFI